MKSNISFAGLVFLLIILSSFSSSVNKDLNSKVNKEIIPSSSSKYRVTAITRNTYGKNYWIDLIVEGSVASYGNKIYRVYYDDGSGLKQIRHYKDYGSVNSYYVSIDRIKYYFTF